MTTNNSNHAIANKTTAIIQKFVLSLRLNHVVSGVSAISSNVTTRSLTRLFMDVQSSRYSQMSQYLSHSQAHMLGLQA